MFIGIEFIKSFYTYSRGGGTFVFAFKLGQNKLKFNVGSGKEMVSRGFG